MKIQQLIVTVGALAAFGLGSVKPAQAGEFKLLQNFLNSISLLGPDGGSQPNSTIQVGPVITPKDDPTERPKRDPLLPKPIILPTYPMPAPVPLPTM